MSAHHEPPAAAMARAHVEAWSNHDFAGRWPATAATHTDP
jgi:hypothetical protein